MHETVVNELFFSILQIAQNKGAYVDRQLCQAGAKEARTNEVG
jgi:hypothetical protein